MPSPTDSRDELRRLYFIDTLFATLTGHDLYLAQQIKDAIAFSLAELEAQTLADPAGVDRYDAAFNAAAAELLTRFFAGRPAQGFYHWDATCNLTAATPLFAREALLIGLKRLAPYRHATLLVTNLRPALLPAEKRVTARRLQEYEDTLQLLRDLAAARTTPRAELQLLFL